MNRSEIFEMVVTAIALFLTMGLTILPLMCFGG